MNPSMQDDPNIVLPPAVRAAAARSAELHRTMQDNPQPEATPVGNQEATPEGNPPLTGEPVVTPEPPLTEAQKRLQPKPAAEPDESWEHKYKSIHGRYTQSQEHVRTLSDKVSNLQNIIATLQAAPAPAEPPAAADTSFESTLTEQEVADYGEDFLKVVGKKAKAEFAPIAKMYEDKIAELTNNVKELRGTTQKNNSEKLLDRLDTQLPDWRKLNTNPEFLDWLRLPDAYSGAIRQDMLTAAYSQGDAHRVLAFFNGFLAEEAVVAPAQAEPDETVTTVPKVPLANLAAPGRAKTAASASAPAEKPLITRAQIASFYADVSAGKYRGRDADKNRLEAMIFEAQQDGRIR